MATEEFAIFDDATLQSTAGAWKRRSSHCGIVEQYCRAVPFKSTIGIVRWLYRVVGFVRDEKSMRVQGSLSKSGESKREEPLDV